MIQFNLLPDVKLEYIKVSRTKRLVMSVSMLAALVSLIIFLILLLTVDVFQAKNMHDLTNDISTNKANLQKVPDLNKILTIQNQLGALQSLHDQKSVASRIVPYMQQLTPNGVTISSISVDFTQSQLTVAGNAPSLSAINAYVDTFKFTTYSTADHTTDNAKAFSNVVLSSFGDNGSGDAKYSVSVSFDKNIFSNTSSVTLTVPPIVSTRSIINQPTDIFKAGH